MPKLTALIVNYATPDLVLKCVASLQQYGIVQQDADVIVVDNASPDNSVEVLRAQLPPNVRFIASDRNGGFSSGINIGLAQVNSEYLLVLNPDTYFVDRSIQRVLEMLDTKPDVGLVGLDLVNPDRSRQFSARRFYSMMDIFGRRSRLGSLPFVRKSVDSHMMLDAWAAGEPFEADWVMGTGFVIRTDLFRAIGGMDEQYFLYMEDVDLCARVWKSGRRVICFAGAVLVHDHQRASAQVFSRSARMHLKSLRTFMQSYRVPLLTKPGVAGVFRRS